MHASIGIWEKMVACREPDDPRSMHNPTDMCFAMMGNKTDMIEYNLTNHVAGDVTSYKTIMDAAFMALEEEASDKAALIAAYNRQTRIARDVKGGMSYLRCELAQAYESDADDLGHL